MYTRRAFEPSSADDLGALDPAAIERVRDEAWPEVRERRRAARRAAHLRAFSPKSKACRAVTNGPGGHSSGSWSLRAERIGQS